jgi:hypothetical protein
VVDNKCRILVAGLDKSLFGLAKEACFCPFEVVNGDAFPWLGGNTDSVLALALFAPPQNLRHRIKQASCTSGSADIDQSLMDLAMAASCWSFLNARCP